MTIAAQLQRAIRNAEKRGWTQYAIAAEAGIDRSQLTRLMKRGAAPRADTIEAICRVIGYEVVIRQRRGKR